VFVGFRGPSLGAELVADLVEELLQAGLVYRRAAGAHAAMGIHRHGCLKMA
jgi:hypothetical protein